MPLPDHIRVRYADGHPLIFERPESQPKSARRAMMVLTGIGWTIWIYLWRPLLTLIGWLLGVNLMQYQWVELSGWKGLVDFSIHTVPYGIALCAGLLTWATANLIRFRGSDRREPRPLATAEADAQWTRTSADTLREGRNLKRLVCLHDKEGHLLGLQAEATDPVADASRQTQEVIAKNRRPTLAPA